METIKKRPWPYVWTTWITGLLARTEYCHWKAWIKAHYYLPRKEEDGESTGRLRQWIAEHDAMTARRVASLTAAGFDVSVENQNSFNLKGEMANLAGKPDIVALAPEKNSILIVDEKSGKPKDQYTWQVLIYMFAKSITHPEHEVEGEIEYKSHIVPVHSRQLNLENKRRIGAMMRLIGGEQEPKRVPSADECRYCDIVGCPDRYEVKVTDARAHF